MIYLLSKDLIVTGILDVGKQNSTPFFGDKFVQELATGAETFEFSLPSDSNESIFVEVGNFVSFLYKGKMKLFQIIETEETHNQEHHKKAYCEMAGIELINDIIRPKTFASVNIEQFMRSVLADTSWTLGSVNGSITDVLTIELKNYDTVYKTIQEHVVGSFGCEIAYRVEIAGNRVVGKYIDVFKQRSSFDGYRFEYGKNINNVSKKVDTSELITALIGVGKDNLTFQAVADGDKPIGQDWVGDDDAYLRYNKNGNHLLGIFQSDSQNATELLALTRKELKRRTVPKVVYEVAVSMLDDNIEIGDTVYVIDNEFTPPLHLSARVSEMETSFTNKYSNSCKLANFREVKSSIVDILNRIVDENDSIKSDLDAVNDRVTGVKNDVVIVDGKVENIEGDVEWIDGKLVEVEGDLTFVEAQVDNVKYDLLFKVDKNGVVNAINNSGAYEKIEGIKIKEGTISAEHIRGNILEGIVIRGGYIEQVDGDTGNTTSIRNGRLNIRGYDVIRGYNNGNLTLDALGGEVWIGGYSSSNTRIYGNLAVQGSYRVETPAVQFTHPNSIPNSWNAGDGFLWYGNGGLGKGLYVKIGDSWRICTVK